MPPPEPAARRLPVWAMGLANMPTGFVFGFISTAMGILLAARGIPVARVGAISAIAFSPSFWAFLLAPGLDVRFTRRAYAFFFATASALLLAASIFALANLTCFTALLTASCACIVLYSAAVQGSAPDAVAEAEYDAMGAWFQVANLGAAGLFSAVAVVLLRTLTPAWAAAVMATLVLAPTSLLLLFPSPRTPAGTLRANFRAMAHDLRRVLRVGRVWIGLTIFLAPASVFALTNLFSTLGNDFHAPERWATGLNGPAVAIVCSLGCLLGIPLCRRWRRRTVYLVAGIAGAACAALMGVLPHTLAVYAAGLLGYNFFQGFNYTSLTALELEIIGPGNALAGTILAMLSASANVPISAMTWVDSRVHDTHGLRAMLFVDAASSLVTAALLLLLVLPLLDRKLLRRDTAAA